MPFSVRCKTSSRFRQSGGEVDDRIAVRAQAGDSSRPAVRKNAVNYVDPSIETMSDKPEFERKASIPETVASKGVSPDIDQVHIREIVPAA
jgi:hypothetical protein